MEDRQIRIALQVYLSLLALIIFSFTGEWEIFVIGLIIANGLAYAFVPGANFLLVLECLGSFFKQRRPAFAEAPARRTRLWQARLCAGWPKSFSAGPPAPLDLAFPWISNTGRKMLTREDPGDVVKLFKKTFSLNGSSPSLIIERKNKWSGVVSSLSFCIFYRGSQEQGLQMC